MKGTKVLGLAASDFKLLRSEAVGSEGTFLLPLMPLKIKTPTFFATDGKHGLGPGVK